MLADYNAGNLSLSSLNDLARHLEQCPRCMGSLQELDNQLDPLVLELRQPVSPQPFDEEEYQRAMKRVERLWNQPLQSSAAPSSTLGSGTKLGPYEILEQLGRGGMGAVYKARHVHLGKLVALKVLLRERLSQADARDRFLLEMKAVGRLNHRNIVLAHDANVEDVPYLAMELLEGTDLHQLVKDLGPLSVANACAIAQQAALGLQHAHEHHLVHRDLKPSNLLLTNRGVVKILDLGLARSRSEQCAPDLLAPPPVATVGSIDYIAPEQLLHSERVDIRADLYSLGCTLYFLLTGQAPFSGPGQTLVQKQQAHLLQAPPDVRRERGDVPAGLAAILQRLLAKTPADRPATPLEVAHQLQPYAARANLAALVSQSSEPLVAAPRAFGPQRLARWTALGLVIVGLLGMLATVPWWREWSSSGSPAIGASLEAYQFRAVARGDFYIGSLGRDSAAASADEDSVRLLARLERPASCYLIAFRPDGSESLCWPASDEQAPPAVTEVSYPSSGLSPLRGAGEGMFAFVLIATHRPLPAYRTWRVERGRAPWESIPAAGVWTYNRQQFERTSRDSVGGDASVPTALRELCRFFQDQPGIETVSALAFPVYQIGRPPNGPPNR
jgi:serine/threonine protein kinase